MLNRQQLSQLYRPVGPRNVWSTTWASGQKQVSSSGQIDLGLPIRGLRFEIKGRLVIGVATFTTVYPQGLLGLIKRLYVFGVNSALGGQTTLLDMSLADLFDFQHLCGLRLAHFDIGGTEIATPTMPYPVTYIPGSTGVAGTYDFRIVFDIPFHPFNCPELARPGFLVRGREWKGTLTAQMEFGTQAGLGATGFLGVSAGTTTVTWSSYGSGAGSPTIDVSVLPVIMGKDVAPMLTTPGVISRVGQPINAILQTAGNGVSLLTLQNRSTPRIFLKNGTLTAGQDAFATLSDANITTLGLQIGSSKVVRPRTSIWSIKQEAVQLYGRDPIQGSILMDFMDSQNADSAYPGDTTEAGAQIQLVADVAGLANAYGIIMQEQQLLVPQGPLYSA